VLLNELFGFRDLLRLQTVVRGEFDRRIDPELGFTARALNMDVRRPFFAREEVEPEPLDSQNRRTHIVSINRKRPALSERVERIARTRPAAYQLVVGSKYLAVAIPPGPCQAPLGGRRL